MRRELTERARATAADLRARMERIGRRHSSQSGWHLERLDYTQLARLRGLVFKASGCELHAAVGIVEVELQELSRLASVADTAACSAFDIARLNPGERTLFAEIRSRATGAKEKPT